ncbi:MAG TPA: hypothetical protein VJ872_20240 [Nocardioides sp.]|nr:hypothetical protein [Nocardioides sp.]
MTQNPGSSEPSQEPTPPTYSQYPADPARPGTPPPPPSTPTYAAPPTYTSGPTPQAPNKARKFGRLGALAAVVLVVGGKIALALGLGGALGFAHDKVEHRVPEAETVVQTVLQSPTGAEVKPYLASGITFATVTDQQCGSFLADKSWSRFTIPKSSKEDDGSADVKVDVEGKSTNILFHMVDQGGWKIERFTCEG